MPVAPEAEAEFRAYLLMLKEASNNRLGDLYQYNSVAELLLFKGSRMGGAGELDQKLMENVRDHSEAKQCYKNCQLLCSAGDWEYCEGYVVRDDIPIPIEHAWLELDGVVYDPTLRAGDAPLRERMEINNREHLYFGVRLNKAEVTDELIMRGESFSVLQDYQNKYPVLMRNTTWLA